jgi:hypothetical protein
MSLLKNFLRSKTIDSLDKELSNITLNRYNVQGDLEKDIDSDDELVNVVSFLLSAIFPKFKCILAGFASRHSTSFGSIISAYITRI